jgi:hypothetical protein
MAKHTIACHDCGNEHAFDENLSFREECERCAADLHVCLTCRFYDRYVENQCRETEADPVQQKDRRNLCEYWKPVAADDGVVDEAAAAKAKLNALFGGGAAPAPSGPEDEHKKKLEALFKKS